MKTFVSANELCHNLAISVQNGPALKEFLDLKTMTVTMQRAKEIFKELSVLFGD